MARAPGKELTRMARVITHSALPRGTDGPCARRGTDLDGALANAWRAGVLTTRSGY